MSETKKTKNPLDELTTAQKTRLNQLETTIGLEGVSVSFSLDGDRDGQGRRKSAFNNARAIPRTGGSWTREEAQAVRCLLSKDVLLATYRDAVFRGIMAKAPAAEEVKGIVGHYDRSLAKLMQRDDHDPRTSFQRTGTKCEVCLEPQFEVPGSGTSCPNGHGGAGAALEESSSDDDDLDALLGDLP